MKMPNIRGKAVRSDLAPPIDDEGRVIWRYRESQFVAANVNRSRRQVAKSQRTPWRRPTT
jgi:hypothetical protein